MYIARTSTAVSLVCLIIKIWMCVHYFSSFVIKYLDTKVCEFLMKLKKSPCQNVIYDETVKKLYIFRNPVD
jgi:hypothetical protein